MQWLLNCPLCQGSEDKKRGEKGRGGFGSTWGMKKVFWGKEGTFEQHLSHTSVRIEVKTVTWCGPPSKEHFKETFAWALCQVKEEYKKKGGKKKARKKTYDRNPR